MLSLAKIPSGGKTDPGPEFSARLSDCFPLPRSCPVTAEHNENRVPVQICAGGAARPEEG